jgi:glycosyltransferase involved in cell wall biosynthesis
MLVRISSIDDSTVTAYGLHDRFVLDLLATLTYGDRAHLDCRLATRTPPSQTKDFRMNTAPTATMPTEIPRVSIVVIGRNEGERLVACLTSIAAMDSTGIAVETIYVDSASTDGSPQRAATMGARVIEACPERPSAAFGRNAGWRAARGEFVLFLDGDTQLHPQFVQHALKEMRDPSVAVVWGHRRESLPQQSVYVRVLDLDWAYATGPSEFCGGDALMRLDVLESVDGFDASLIAGEEPELCRRIRAAGHTILHIDAPMTLHDLAINRFGGYWKRAFRAGYAYAEVSARYQDSADPLWRADARRNLFHGSLLLGMLALLPLTLLWPFVGMVVVIAAFGLIGRTFHRCAWKTANQKLRLLYALHSHVQQIPILAGQLSYHHDLWFGKRRGLIEYSYQTGVRTSERAPS